MDLASGVDLECAPLSVSDNPVSANLCGLVHTYQILGRLNLFLKKSDLIKSGIQPHQTKSNMKIPYEASLSAHTFCFFIDKC